MSNKNTENKAPRITKSQRFEDIIALLTGENVTYGTTVEDAVAVLTHERELLAKKNASGDKKQTATQKANEGYMDEIVAYLGTQTEPVTCTQVHKAIASLSEYNNQKVAYLLRALTDAGKVVRTESKGKTLFALAR